MESASIKTKSAYIAILLLGIVSLMGDVVYEGSRGIVPSYLVFLGASAFIIAFVGRLGEFLGYAFRLISGILSDTTKAYWFFIFLGYGLIVSIPLLGFTSIWTIAIILILLERLGKAFRSPSRDAVLSMVSKDMGAGKAFGVHELLDQIGAILGPILVTGLMFYSGNNYSQTFSLLLLPFIVLMATLVYTNKTIGKVKPVKPEKVQRENRKLGKAFYIYAFAVAINALGLIPYELILYKASTILRSTEQWIVPLIYTGIQAVDAPSALLSGYSYDRFKLKILVLPFVLSVIPPILTLANADLPMLVIAAVFFGLVLGMQESIYRAAVSDFAPISSRGTAYGVFNTAYGVGMLAGGTVYGLIAELKPSLIFVASYVFATQALAVLLLLKSFSKEENVKT
ncbi:MAG: MFS transporter [Candidatus Bathyarchaeia archaeon]